MLLPTLRDLNVIAQAFPALRQEETARLTAPARIVTLAKRELLFRQDSPATALFILVDGMLKLYRLTDSGEEAIIQVLKPGESVAAASAFASRGYLVTAEAASEVRVIRIPIDHVIRCIREMPNVTLAVIGATSQHFRHLMQHLEELKAQNGFQRVTEFLASLCPVDNGSSVVMLPYDKALIAGWLGIKPESLSRAFAKLKAVGVEVCGPRVAIKDVAALRRLAFDREEAVPSDDEFSRKLGAFLRSGGASASIDPHASTFPELLIRRMAALELDFKEVSRRDPQAFRELRKVCRSCKCRGRCMADIAATSTTPAWMAYCPNAGALNALHAH